MNRKKDFLIIINLVILTVICILVATVLMILLYSLPTERIYIHEQNSINVLTSNIIYNWAGGRYSAISNSTDSIMLNNAICRSYSSPIKNAMLNPAFIYKDSSRIANLTKYLNNTEGFLTLDYPKYWHGYLLYMIPALQLFDIAGLKMFMMFVQILLLVLFVIELYKLKDIYSFVFVIGILFINPVTTVLTFQEADVYIISLLFSIIILRYNKFISEKNIFPYLFLVNGILVCYIDFLTYPLVAWGFPMIIYILINKDNVKLVNKTILYSLCWIIGYAGMWAGKWIVASILTNSNIISIGIKAVLDRTVGTDDQNNKITYMNTITTIWHSINDVPNLFLYFVGFVGEIYYVFINRKRIEFNVNQRQIISLILVCIAPFVWYCVAKNHAYIHPWLEYRQLSLTLITTYLIIVELFNMKKI